MLYEISFIFNMIILTKFIQKADYIVTVIKLVDSYVYFCSLIRKCNKISNTFRTFCFVFFIERQKCKEICVIFGEGSVNEQICLKWLVIFCTGDLNNIPQLGWPTEYSNNQIRTFFGNNAMWLTYPNQVFIIICTCLVAVIVLIFIFYILL